MKNIILLYFGLFCCLHIVSGQTTQKQFHTDSLLQIDVSMSRFQSHKVGGAFCIKNPKGNLVNSKKSIYTILTIKITNNDTVDKFIPIADWSLNAFDKEDAKYEFNIHDLPQYNHNQFIFLYKTSQDYDSFNIVTYRDNGRYLSASPSANQVKKITKGQSFYVHMTVADDILDFSAYKCAQFIVREMMPKKEEKYDEGDFYVGENIFLDFFVDEPEYHRGQGANGKSLSEYITKVFKDRIQEDSIELEEIKLIKTPIFTLIAN